ncbi:MAG: MGH1-like glycoside hydrolase domain-containing protein [Niabella sp.]
MRIKITSVLLMAILFSTIVRAQSDIASIKKVVYNDYRGMFHQPSKVLPYPFVTPGSVYSNDLWDWDSWLSHIALAQIVEDQGVEADRKAVFEHGIGCIKNFLQYTTPEGYMPIVIWSDKDPLGKNLPDIYNTNMHKPVIAQHAAFITQLQKGDASWLTKDFDKLKRFMMFYRKTSFHNATGLYFWLDDLAVGVDNDPSVFYRPHKSSGNIFLNCLMYKELMAMAYLAKQLKFTTDEKLFAGFAADLKKSIQENCWDEKDGVYYSVDINLLPVTDTLMNFSGLQIALHKNHPRNYHSLIQRFGGWSGFMALWAGVATPSQARRIVTAYSNKESFNAAFGVRTLSKQEKMYSLYAGGNPSNWLGPVWGVSNYMVYSGLKNYGYTTEAKQLALKTIRLFGADAKKNQAFHEYYNPDTGQPIINKGFQNWNYLVMNMIAWVEHRTVIQEF